MNYIGQAAAGISVTDLRRNDALEDGPSVKEWVSSFSDIVRVCRISLRFARDSLRYIRDAVPGIARRWNEGYSLEPAPFFPAGSVRDLNGMEESLKVPEMTEALEAVRSGGPFFPLDNLIARADHKWWHFWDRRADWTIALLLERAGRSAEASFFMGRFEASELSVFGLAEGEAGAFYRDFARILSARDLCRETNWDRVALASKKGSLPDAPTGRKRDAERMAWSLKASEGRLFFEYAPRYLVDGSRALLEDAARFAAAARYKKRQVLDFDPGAGEAPWGALSTGSGDESPAGFGAEPHDLFYR
jgi:hypothetical protein